MSASFEAILLSRFFTFVVGTDAVPIVVHEATVADQSPELAALTRGKMLEGLAAEARWEDVDKGTFIRFAQFAYIGDYSTPQMMIEPTEILPSIDTWSFGQVKKAGKRHASEPLDPIPAFKSLSYPLPLPRFNFADTCEPTVAEGPNQNIGEILIIHASIYILAEEWGVDRLKRLALFKIHKTLCLFSLDMSKLEHVIDFVRYAYEGTPDLRTKIDGLRELICHYIAANTKLTAENTTFLALIEEGGPFARDLWRLVAPKAKQSD